MLKVSIQGAFSTNCISAVPSLKRLYNGSVTRKLTMAPTRAIQRTARACSSLPRASSTAPNTIGVQMARLKRPTFLFSLAAQPDEPCHEDEDPQEHGQRVVIQVAGLPAAHDA